MSIPLIISYFTDDPIYRPAADRLRASLERFKLNHKIQCCPVVGSWLQNGHYKAVFVTQTMQTLKCDLIWLDADAEVMQFPDKFATLTGDVAAHTHRGEQIAGGTLFFRYIPIVQKLLADWIKTNQKYPKDNDQQNLQKAIRQYGDRINYEELPFAYNRIFDYPSTEEAVILQHQASRQGQHIYGYR